MQFRLLFISCPTSPPLGSPYITVTLLWGERRDKKWRKPNWELAGLCIICQSN